MSWSGTVEGRVGYGYDDDFRINALQIGDLGPIGFGYDDDGRLVGAGALQLGHDPGNGLLLGTAIDDTVDRYDYDPFGDVARYTASHDAASLLDVVYERDALGRITRKVETTLGVTTTTDYAYDLAGRLEEVRSDGTVTATYLYDDNGNRLRRSAPGTDEVGEYDEQDRLLGYGEPGNLRTYTYTPNGELATRTLGTETTHYAYDELGNLLQVILADGTELEYLLDGQNRRIGKRVDGSLVEAFLYQDQLNPVAQLDTAGNVTARFVYAERAHVPSLMLTEDELGLSRRYRIVSDHLGSVRLVVDVETGAIAQRLDYDEWGNVLLDTAPGFQPFGYAGGLYDPDTGLVRFGARDYDPEVGRWTAKDPIGFGGNDSNLYQYTYGDPVNSIDPTGEIGLVGAGVGAAIGGASSFFGTLATGGSLPGAAISGLIGAGAGAIAGMFPGVGALSAILRGGGLGGAANVVAQAADITMNPCLSIRDVNLGSVVGSVLGGMVSVGLNYPGGNSIAVQVGSVGRTFGVTATTGGIGTNIGQR